jgi:ABC-type transporter Mla maintaining outer membrane lipid asymmetry permease subunit MlaE
MEHGARVSTFVSLAYFNAEQNVANVTETSLMIPIYPLLKSLLLAATERAAHWRIPCGSCKNRRFSGT